MALYPVYKITFFREKGLLPAKFFLVQFRFLAGRQKLHLKRDWLFTTFKIFSISNRFWFLIRLLIIPFFGLILTAKIRITFSRSKILGILKQIFFLNLYLRIFLVKQVSSKNCLFYGLPLWHLHWISGLYSASNSHNFCIVV